MSPTSRRHEIARPVTRGRSAPRRTCVGCRRTRAKTELLRLARTPEGVRFDPRQRLPGRGAYVCPRPDCIDAAARRSGHAVRRALRGGSHDQVGAALDEITSHLTSVGGTYHEEHTA